MTQEEKQLLMKDLLPRQLYGVKAHYRYYDFVGGTERFIQEGDDVIESIDVSLGNPVYIHEWHIEIEDIKPYLRPMSSMTEEEKEKLKEEHKKDEKVYVEVLERIANGDESARGTAIPHFAADWCNKTHFDYRGLIEKGLALEAPKGMYKSE